MTMMSNKDTCPTDAQDDPRARDLLRRAFEKTARWPADFHGLSADLTINVEGSAITAEKKYLTTRYTVYYFNPQDGRLANVESFTDTHVRVGQTDLPASRRIISAGTGAVSVKTLTFSDHRLL